MGKKNQPDASRTNLYVSHNVSDILNPQSRAGVPKNQNSCISFPVFTAVHSIIKFSVHTLYQHLIRPPSYYIYA